MNFGNIVEYCVKIARNNVAIWAGYYLDNLCTNKVLNISDKFLRPSLRILPPYKVGSSFKVILNQTKLLNILI